MKNYTLKKKSGFTVVESLIALAIVSVVSLAGLGTMSYIRKVKNRSKEVCAAHVVSTVEKFRSIGYFAAISKHIPSITSPNFDINSNPNVSLSQFGLPDEEMYPNISLITYPSGSTPPTINNNILITSSLNALTAIYNSSASFCANANGAPYVSSVTPSVPSKAFGFPSPELNSSSLSLRIVPYNTRTGTLDTSCPTNLRLVPPGRFLDNEVGSSFASPGGSAPAKLSRPPSQRTDLGLSLRVTQTYIDEDNVAQSCSIEQRFQYAADTVAPPPPDKFVMTQTAGPVRATTCPAPTYPANRFEVTVGYENNILEPGSIMVCRDVSVRPTSPASGYMLAACGGSNAPAPTIPSSNTSTSSPTGLSPTVTGMAYNYNSTASASSPQWVPCDQVTACGVSPTGGGTTSGTTDKPIYNLVYNSLPYLCRVYIQVAAIDTASNSSDTNVTAHQVGNPTVADTSVNMLTWDVPIPNCGRDCSSGYSGFSPYYRCNNCPVYP